MNILKRLYKKLNVSNTCSYIDALELGDSTFYIKGWMFNKQHPYTTAVISFETPTSKQSFPITLAERMDVVEAHQNTNAKHSGFEFNAHFKTEEALKIYLECNYNGGTDRELVASRSTKGGNTGISVSKVVCGYCNYSEFKDSHLAKTELNFPSKLYDNEIDVVIPIYNGFDYLENLLKTVEKTKMRYRLLLINDCSPDERVLPYLMNYAQDKDNVVLIDNKENLGFVQSVNKALTLSDKHIALVNSDVIMPEFWLERLMLPIIQHPDIASTTPFTNSGTICSFPNFCEDNSIFMNLEVDEVDSVFKTFAPSYVSMPTGVGFCMGMNREAINRVGTLDAETFYKGYGEENDWCQRSIKMGYRNVQVENMFVYHKHGASFPSEDKKRYIERNLKLLNQMHPNYDADVQKYLKADPSKHYREYAKWQLMAERADKLALIFDHNWGGGANSYCKIRIKNELSDGYTVIKVTNDSINGMYAELTNGEHTAGFAVASFDELDELLNGLNIKKIIINELVSFADVYPVLDYLKALKTRLNARLIMLGHDYYSVCPSIYLINNEGKHCFKCDKALCEDCIKSNKDSLNDNYESIKKWREEWGKLLAECDEVTVFSNNTKDYFEYHYPQLKNLVITPHVVDYIAPIEPYKTDKERVKVGILGNFMRTKGSEVVLEMADYIRDYSLPMDIIVIGQNLEQKTDKDLKITGRYRVEDIPTIMRDNKIDIIFIASIWPETFSYTTEEVIKMGLPVASFDIGAPAERIAKYDKGLIITEMTAGTAVEEILKFIKK